MLCAPTASALLLQMAVLLLPEPLSATVPQPLIVVPPSLKLTLPVGAAPTTVAVNVTFDPTVAGFAELVSDVVVDVKPAAATPQASTSVMRE